MKLQPSRQFLHHGTRFEKGTTLSIVRGKKQKNQSKNPNKQKQQQQKNNVLVIKQ